MTSKPPEQDQLFASTAAASSAAPSGSAVDAPLAARMRPSQLADYVAPDTLLGPESMLRRALDAGRLPSLILWGPPGTGKTTLALLLAAELGYCFESISAVMAGVKDIRAIVERASANAALGKQTLLFIDEVHRFSKSQQDALLPHVESGLFTLIGATTENPAFEINNALLSRLRVVVLEAIPSEQLQQLLCRALQRDERLRELDVAEPVLAAISQRADGDARRALNTLETLADWALASGHRTVEDPSVLDRLGAESVQYDKGGDHFYDQISALHKAIRGSSPDAALYWLARMLLGGCDPVYLARRLLRMASEDIGLADPRAVAMALSGWDSYVRLGSPEGDLALAEVAVYLAVAPKSNAVYTAFKSALSAAREHGAESVPLHIRNAPTELASSLGHGADYRYAHDYEDGFVAGENYLPEVLSDSIFYRPGEQGLEARIRARLEAWAAANRDSEFQRYPR